MSLLNDLGFNDGEIAAIADVPATAPPTATEVSFEAQQVIDLSRSSLDFLAGLAMPTVYQFAFPPVFLAVWDWLISFAHKQREFPQLALGLPRGFSKTTVMKLFILYCILFTDKKFILIVAENLKKAENILADVMDMLEEENIKKTFGDWRLGIENERLDLKKFGYRGRNITLAALGSGGDPRGLNIKNQRPDIILMDDIQSRDCADSEQQSATLERWIYGTLMKAKSPFGCMFLFTANMYPTNWSILRKLKKNRNWTKFITGGILADGSSLWEDLQPIEQLLREYENDLESGHPEIFYAEVLNDETASANNLIDLSKLPPLPYEEGDIPAGNFIVIDPATGKVNSDALAIGYFEVYEGYPVLKELRNERFSPGESIRVALELALRHNCRLICIESVAYQSTLGYWFKFICEQRGIYGIECVEIYPGGSSKNSRILTMFKQLSKGEIFVHDTCRSEVFLQIMQFNPLKRDNIDDILDLLTYAPKVIDMFGEYIVSMNVIINDDNSSIEVLPAGVNCCF